MAFLGGSPDKIVVKIVVEIHIIYRKLQHASLKLLSYVVSLPMTNVRWMYFWVIWN